MRKRTALIAVVAVVAALFAGGSATAQTGQIEGRKAPERLSGEAGDFQVRSLDDVVQVFIQFDEPSVAEFAAANGAGSAAQRSQGRAVTAQQRRVGTQLGGLVVERLSTMVIGANGWRAKVRAGDIPAIRATPGVESVAPVTRYHLTNATSVPSIGGTEVSDAGFDGDGLTVAVIDTGIDYTHVYFDGAGDPDDYAENDKGLIEPGTFPTGKVINGFDFAGPVYDASSLDPAINTPQPDPDPLDGNGHGSHVAATIAGLDPDGPLGPGMAPAASLVALKVFSDGGGSTDVVSDAIEFALDPNNDMSMDDAVDVINMSLGSDFGHPDDPSAIASQNAVDAGVVVVASSGNAGDVPYMTGSPAVADGVISVAASADAGVVLGGITVNSPASISGDYEAAGGDFAVLDPPTTADLGVETANFDACTPFTQDMTGLIALVKRGTCAFTVKVRNAENAGAVGALIFNNESGPPGAMAHDGSEPKPTIPAVMVSLADGEAIQAVALNEEVNVTFSDEIAIPRPDLADTMASFTSRGPGFGSTFKPDLSAPGFSIESAAVGTGDGGALLSGTSMASPHVAGAALQLLDAHPDLDPAQVKALLMNSARPAQPEGGVDVGLQGTGVVQIDRAALDLEGYATPAGLSFGRLNPTTAGAETETITVSRLDGEGDATYAVELIPHQTLPGVTWSLSSDTVTTSGGTGTLDVTLTFDPAAMDTDNADTSQAETDGWIRLTNVEDENDTMVVGLLAVADPASTVTVIGGEDGVSISNGGPSTGPASGYTLIAEGDGSDAFGAIGFRTVAAEGYDVIEFGLAGIPWSHPSATEVDIWINTDDEPDDEYLLVAADLGLLSGGDPNGSWVTALLNLDTEDFPLEYFGVVDLNDEVAGIPVDLTGDLGFNPADTFEIDVEMYDSLGLAGLVLDVPVDLNSEITSEDGLAFDVDTAGGEVATRGTGDMLWLFANNPLGTQHAIVSVTESEPPVFSDVPGDHLFADEINWLLSAGITRGCNPPANTHFCPDDSITRGEMAAFLNRALTLPGTAEDFFVDDETSVFEGDINELAAAGITKGCNPPTDDQFCPERTLSRAEMATFMMRGYALAAGAGDDLFVDDDGNIHEDAIDIMGTAGITKGCNPPANDQFCPDRLITRGEMAAFLYRAFNTTGLGGG